MPHYENVPFEVPKGWVWCMLQDITKIIGDGLHGTPEYDSNGEYHCCPEKLYHNVSCLGPSPSGTLAVRSV